MQSQSLTSTQDHISAQLLFSNLLEIEKISHSLLLLRLVLDKKYLFGQYRSVTLAVSLLCLYLPYSLWGREDEKIKPWCCANTTH